MARMVRVFIGILLSFAVHCGVLTAAFALEFSADMVSRTGGQTMQSKISVKDQKSRVEMPEMTMIQRGDLKVTWMVMNSERMYMEHPFDPRVLAQTGGAEGETERVPLGKESINGQPADKFKVTYSNAGKMESVYQWMGTGPIPLKVAAVDDSWSVEYQNIQTSGISDALFEVPAGYQKLQMPGMIQ